MSDRKIHLYCKFAIKHFGATVANADTESLKFLHTLFDTYLDHMLVKFEPNRMVQNFELLGKNRIFKTNFDKGLTPFCMAFLS